MTDWDQLLIKSADPVHMTFFDLVSMRTLRVPTSHLLLPVTSQLKDINWSYRGALPRRASVFDWME